MLEAFVVTTAWALSAPKAAAPVRLRELSDRYENWVVDVKGFEESRSDPLVYVDRSPFAGLGVFAKRAIPAGATITEWVGCLTPNPETLCDEFELQQEYYGSNWREYSHRYEIGLSASRVASLAGTALGASYVGVDDVMCDVDSDYESCVVRAGEGEYLLLGKVPAQGASPHEGVAQLINDHTPIRAPVDPLKMRASVKAAVTGGDGALRASDVDGFLVQAPDGTPLAVDYEKLEAAVDTYIANIEPRNNVALVQAQIDVDGGVLAPRIFAVATRPIPAGTELRYTYGVEWWLSQLRRAALAQLVTCSPKPARASALAALIRSIEDISKDKESVQREAIAEAGSMPYRYVLGLSALPPLDDLLAGEVDENWRKALLLEELALATECPVDFSLDVAAARARKLTASDPY